MPMKSFLILKRERPMIRKIKKAKVRRKAAKVTQNQGVVSTRKALDSIRKNFFEIYLLMTTPSSNLIFKLAQKTRGILTSIIKVKILKVAPNTKLTLKTYSRTHML